MKINGRKLTGLNTELLVIPRPDLEDGSSGDIVFKAQAVNDFTEFESLVPRPVPPNVTRRGETKGSPDFTDREYKGKVANYVARRTEYLIIKSLEPSPDLEWETVDLDKPETWKNYVTELKDSGFSEVEIAKIVDLAVAANGMDEDKYKEARLRFLASQAQSQESSPSQDIAPVSTPSSGPAKGSA